MSSTKEKIRERRLDRMRLGQAVCDVVALPSDPEIQLYIVPLTEAEYLQAINRVAELKFEDNLAGVSVRERVQAQEILVRAIREPDDLLKRVYDNVEEMTEDIDVGDVDVIFDRYSEMVANSSPSLESIPPEEFENLKVLLQEMDWSALSGRQWYAAKRFLSAISPSPLMDKSLGSISTKSLTTTTE